MRVAFFELKDLNRLSDGSALLATFGRYGNQHANYGRQYGQQGSYLLASPKSCRKIVLEVQGFQA